MISTSLGTMVQDPDIEEWWVSSPVSVPVLGTSVEFVLDGVAEDDRGSDFEDAVASFLALAPADRALATPHVYSNYRQFVDMVGEEEFDFSIEEPEDVWKHVRVSRIYVERRHRRDRCIYIQVSAECDWEVEHGLLLVFREGTTLSRVSAQDGHLTHTDAYDLPEEQDRIS